MGRCECGAEDCGHFTAEEAEEAFAVLRLALKGYGPWAHTMGCGTNVGKDCDCWIGRARRLLGMEG